jgi:5-dehydro-4-deoxyglucarate dehydratase
MVDGLLFFPVTPFTPDDRVNLDVLAEHVDTGVRAGAGAAFVACGTGEFHALSADEIASVVRKATETVAGRVPVFNGAGGPLPVAVRIAAEAAAAGSDGLLLMPPYLASGPQEGLVRYVRTVAVATPLPVIVYHRGTAVFQPETAVQIAAIDNVIGIKDGVGDVDLMQRIVVAVRERLAAPGPAKPFGFFNGLPTAELSQRGYAGIGVDRYSSAVFAYAPEIAMAFFTALRRGDAAASELLLRRFYLPLGSLRAIQPGYAVSLVKAGVALRGLDVGTVRPPLAAPRAADIAALESLIADGLAAVEQIGEPGGSAPRPSPSDGSP